MQVMLGVSVRARWDASLVIIIIISVVCLYECIPIECSTERVQQNAMLSVFDA